MKLTAMITIGLGGILLLFSTTTTATPWKLVAPMLLGRMGHDATAGPDGKIYVMGGVPRDYEGKTGSYRHDDGRYSNVVYDPDQDRWQVLWPVPGFFYNVYKMVYHFDPNTDTWGYFSLKAGAKHFDRSTYIWSVEDLFDGKRRTYKHKIRPAKGKEAKLTTNLPQDVRLAGCQRQGDGVALVTGNDGKVYWSGGSVRQGPSSCDNLFLPFNPVTGRWPEVGCAKVISKSLPEGRYGFHHGFHQGPDPPPGEPWSKHMGTVAVASTVIFKTRVPAMQEPRMDHEAVATEDGKIYTLGGRVNFYFQGEHKDRYQKKEPYQKLVSQGGYMKEWKTGKVEISSYHTAFDSVECYDPVTNHWEFRAPMKQARFLFGAAAVEDKVYVMGGYGNFKPDRSYDALDSVEMYDPATDTWTPRKSMPKARGAISAVRGADGKIYVMGGSEKGRPVKEVWIYDPAKDHWGRGPDMNIPRSTLAAAALPDGRIYAIGGTDAGAYPKASARKTRLYWNILISPEEQKKRKEELYTGKVQDTLEMLNVFDLHTDQ